jgi:NADPH-dependent curcumin reductase CurA
MTELVEGTVNHQVRLAARPSGLPGPEVWEQTTEPVPAPGEGRFVVRSPTSRWTRPCGAG